MFVYVVNKIIYVLMYYIYGCVYIYIYVCVVTPPRPTFQANLVVFTVFFLNILNSKT